MAKNSNSIEANSLRPAPVRKFTGPIRRFLHVEASSGIVLMICTVVALICANSAWGNAFHDFWETTVHLGVGEWNLDRPIHFWVNDALMTIFFFVVGLEIKREIVDGELNSLKKASLPIMAAIGGMVVPAATYFAIESGTRGARGWGIPMATDIAFVVGVMALFGPRVPFGLKIFLLSVAIADDMGAVLVIAIAYTEQLNMVALALCACGLATTITLNKLGVRSVAVYVIVGVPTWFAVYKSGIHPTIAGVMLGLLTPTRAWLSTDSLYRVMAEILKSGRAEQNAPLEVSESELLVFAARESVSPLMRLDSRLHPWVGFFILPLFALANAGVEVRAEAIQDEVAIAIALSLVFGKVLGIGGFSYIAVKLGIAQLPAGVNWSMIWAAGMLGGIGFTMSLFVAGLAFKGPQDLIDASKTGIILGSATAAILGALMLWYSLPKGKPKTEEPPTA